MRPGTSHSNTAGKDRARVAWRSKARTCADRCLRFQALPPKSRKGVRELLRELPLISNLTDYSLFRFIAAAARGSGVHVESESRLVTRFPHTMERTICPRCTAQEYLRELTRLWVPDIHHLPAGRPDRRLRHWPDLLFAGCSLNQRRQQCSARRQLIDAPAEPIHFRGLVGAESRAVAAECK